jgi:hypothetical protein
LQFLNAAKANRTSWAMQNDPQDENPTKKLCVLGELCERSDCFTKTVRNDSHHCERLRENSTMLNKLVLKRNRK